jgi:hypothetical protein
MSSPIRAFFVKTMMDTRIDDPLKTVGVKSGLFELLAFGGRLLPSTKPMQF